MTATEFRRVLRSLGMASHHQGGRPGRYPMSERPNLAAASKVLGVGQQTISRWATGRRPVPAPIVKLLRELSPRKCIRELSRKRD
jgi:hypothetical protein